MSGAPCKEFTKKLIKEHLNEIYFAKVNDYIAKQKDDFYYIFRRRMEDYPWELTYKIHKDFVDKPEKWIVKKGAFANDRLVGQYKYYMSEEDWAKEKKRKKKRKVRK